MVLAGSLVALVGARARPTTLTGVGAIGLGATVAATAGCSEAWHLMLFFFAAGWFITPVQASVTTILQTAVPAHVRGRAQASFATVTSAANLASMALAALAAGAAGIRPVFVVAGLIIVAAGLASVVASRGPRTAAAAPALEPR